MPLTVRLRQALPLIFTLLTVATVGVLTMPSQLYPGDNHGIRLAATNLYLNGDIGIDYSLRENLYPYLSAKGQVFLENDERQKFYSRWGEFNTFLFALPELIRQPEKLELKIQEVVPYANAMSLIFTLLSAAYFYLLSRRFGGSPWAAATLVLCSFYGGFEWVYLRAQTYEVVHLFLFTASTYHFVRHLQVLKRPVSGDLLTSQLLLFMLVLSKSTFFILYLAYFLILWQLHKPARDHRQLGRTKYNDWVTVASFMSIALGLHFFLVYWKTGILQLTTEGAAFPNTHDVFSFRNFIPRLSDYTLNPKASLILLAPIVVFALPFWRCMLKQYRLESHFLLFTIAIFSTLLLFFYARGEVCYGPRYFSFLIPVMALPVLRAFDNHRWWSRAFCGLLLIVTLFEAQLHFHFNSRSVMLWHQFSLWVIKAENPGTARSYLDHTNEAKVAADFNAFMSGKTNSFPPIEIFMGSSATAETLKLIRADLAAKLPCNFYFSWLCPKTAL